MTCFLASSVKAANGCQTQTTDESDRFLEQEATNFYLRMKKYAINVSAIAEPSRRVEILNKNLAWVDDYYKSVVLGLQKILGNFREIAGTIYPALHVPEIMAERLLLERFFNMAFLKYVYGETESFERALERMNVATLLFHLASSSRYEGVNDVEEEKLIDLLFLLGPEAFTALLLLGKLDSKDFADEVLKTIYAIYGGDLEQAIKIRTDLLGSVVLDILQHDPESLISVLETVATTVNISRGSNIYDIYLEHPLLFLKVCFEKSSGDGTHPDPKEWITKYKQLCQEKLSDISKPELVAALWNGLTALIQFSHESYSARQVILIFKKDLTEYANMKHKNDHNDRKPVVSLFDQVRKDIILGRVLNQDYEPKLPGEADVKEPIPL